MTTTTDSRNSQTMHLSVALNRASKARRMLAFFDEQESAGFPVWDAEAVASGRQQFRRSGAEACAALVVQHGWTDDMIDRALASY